MSVRSYREQRGHLLCHVLHANSACYTKRFRAVHEGQHHWEETENYESASAEVYEIRNTNVLWVGMEVIFQNSAVTGSEVSYNALSGA